MELKECKVGSERRVQHKSKKFPPEEVEIMQFNAKKTQVYFIGKDGKQGWATTDDYELIEVVEGEAQSKSAGEEDV